MSDIHPSQEIQDEIEARSRHTLTAQNDFLLHPYNDYTLQPVDIGVLITAAIFTITYFFVFQVGLALNKSTVEATMPGSPWQAGVVLICGLQFLASVILTEMFALTRVLTTTVSAVMANIKPKKVDGLMDRLTGASPKVYSAERQYRVIGTIVISFLLLFVVLLSIAQSWQTGNWTKPIFVALAFISDTIIGVGPVVLLFKLTIIWRRNWQNRLAEKYYKQMEERWNLVCELFDGWRSRHFEEHPEFKNEIKRLPAISPLAGFIVSNACTRDVKIPDDVLRATPDGNKDTTTKEKAQPTSTGDKSKDDDDKEAGAAAVTEENNPLDDPDPVFSATQQPEDFSTDSIDNENL